MKESEARRQVIIRTDETISFTLERATPKSASVRVGEEVRAVVTSHDEGEVLVSTFSAVIGHATEEASSRILELIGDEPWATFIGQVAAVTDAGITVSLTLHTPLNLSRLLKLDLDAPPMLAQAVGYEGTGRFVGIYWIPYGDEVMYTDGVRSATGNWYAWLQFVRHQRVAPHIEDFDFGASEQEAEHWLVVDTETLSLYVGFPDDVTELLITSWKHKELPPVPAFLAELAASQQTTTFEEEIERLSQGDLSGWVEVQPPDMQTIAALLERDARLTGELAAWLNNGERAEAKAF